MPWSWTDPAIWSVFAPIVFKSANCLVARRWNQWFAEGFAAAGARRRMERTLRVIFTDGGDVSLTIRHGVVVPGNAQMAL